MRTLLITAILLGTFGCAGEAVRENRYPRPGGGAVLLERTIMGGGAAGYAYTEYQLRFEGEEQPYPIAVVDHGGANARWTDGKTLELCFQNEPQWAFLGTLWKGDQTLQIRNCPYVAP